MIVPPPPARCAMGHSVPLHDDPERLCPCCESWLDWVGAFDAWCQTDEGALWHAMDEADAARWNAVGSAGGRVTAPVCIACGGTQKLLFRSVPDDQWIPCACVPVEPPWEYAWREVVRRSEAYLEAHPLPEEDEPTPATDGLMSALLVQMLGER